MLEARRRARCLAHLASPPPHVCGHGREPTSPLGTGAGAGFRAARAAVRRSPLGPDERTPAPAPRTGLLPDACPPAPPRRALPPPPGTAAPAPPRVTAWCPPPPTQPVSAATRLKFRLGSASTAHAHGRCFRRARAIKRTVARRLQHSGVRRTREAGPSLGGGAGAPPAVSESIVRGAAS